MFEIKSLMVFMYSDKCPCTNKWKNGRDKREFYSLLEQNIDQIARSDIKIILADFNAKFSKESIYKPTIGNENLHNEINDNG